MTTRTRIAVLLVVASMLALASAAEQKTFQVGPGGRLEIELETGGSVEIRGSATNNVTVEWVAGGRDAANVRVDAKASGSGVKVESSYVERRRNNSTSLEVKITVPDRFDAEIDTTGGDIEIHGVEGRINGKTMGGNLVVANVKGSLNLSTMGGSVSVSDSDVDGKVSSMGGNVTVKNVAGDLDASTHGGNVTLENVAQRGAHSIDEVVTVSTLGGNIVVADAPQGARVSTNGGNVTVKKAAKFVEAETLGGNIKINEIDGRVEAKTNGGNVEVMVVGTAGDQSIDIESLGGRIELTVPASFSGNFDVELSYTRRHQGEAKITSDFPLTIQESPDWDYGQGDPRKRIMGKGKSGAGTNAVKLRTINGDIVIRRK